MLPGGFSYGDYLRAGAIAALAPIMAEMNDAAAKGIPVLGICNGFQILAEARLVPGGLTRNAHQQFIRRDQKLRVEKASTAWTAAFAERPRDRDPDEERGRSVTSSQMPKRSTRSRARARRVPLGRREPQRLAE